MTLFSRLFRLFLSVIITPLFVTGVFLFYYQSHSKTAILENYFNLADISASYIRRNIEDSASRLDFLGRALSEEDRQSGAAEKILNDCVRSNPEIIFLAILGSDGKERLRSGGNEAARILPVIDISGEPSFGEINEKDISISYLDYTLDNPYVELIYPLRNGEYIFAVLNLIHVWYSVGAQRLGVTGGLYLASEEGFLDYNVLPVPDIAGPVLAAALKKGNGLIKGLENQQGEKFVGAYSGTVLPGVYVLVLQYSREAFYTITLTSWIIVFFILATTTLSYFAAYSFSKDISEPAERLTAAAKKISSGDFDVSLDSSGSWGEFEILINTFNEMASRLSAYQAVHLDKLLDEKKKIDMLAGLMRDGLIMCTLQGRLLFANATAKKIMESDALCGDLECTLYGTMARPGLKELTEIKSGTVFAYESGGKKTYFEIVNELFRPVNEEAVSIIIFRDITAEHEIRTMKNDIFNAVAHDLRAPIMGLQAYIMILKEGHLSEDKKREMLNAMENSSAILSSLVENILDISRFERGLLTLNKKEFDLSDSLNSVITSLKPLADAKGIYIRSAVPAGLKVLGDRGMLERVFSNLISNSVKFTERGGVDIGYEYSADGAKGPYHKFIVKDSGCGISKEELPKIFDKYHRADRNEKGYGLGLSIVRQSVLAHGGEIEADSEEGKGSEIKFTLPASEVE